MNRAKVNQNIDLDCYNNVWVIGEQVNGEIHPVTVELLGEGKKASFSRKTCEVGERSCIENTFSLRMDRKAYII